MIRTTLNCLATIVSIVIMLCKGRNLLDSSMFGLSVYWLSFVITQLPFVARLDSEDNKRKYKAMWLLFRSDTYLLATTKKESASLAIDMPYEQAIGSVRFIEELIHGGDDALEKAKDLLK